MKYLVKEMTNCQKDARIKLLQYFSKELLLHSSDKMSNDSPVEITEYCSEKIHVRSNCW